MKGFDKLRMLHYYVFIYVPGLLLIVHYMSLYLSLQEPLRAAVNLIPDFFELFQKVLSVGGLGGLVLGPDLLLYLNHSAQV